MEERNELASRVLSSQEFIDYIECKKRVESNAPLYAMIGEYEKATASLLNLLEAPDYDAAEAIRLTNDAEYLNGQIENHPDYIALAAANDRLQAVMARFVGTCRTCNGTCEGCSQGCHKE